MYMCSFVYITLSLNDMLYIIRFVRGFYAYNIYIHVHMQYVAHRIAVQLDEVSVLLWNENGK